MLPVPRSSVKIARAIMLTHLGKVTRVPEFESVPAAEIAMALAGMVAACFNNAPESQDALWQARLMVDAPVPVAVVAAMLDGGDDVLEQAAEMCSEFGNDRMLLVQMIALGRVATLFCDAEEMVTAISRVE